jgi:hypothetical protein
MEQHHDILKPMIDVFSVATVVGTLANMLPAAAAAFSIVWSLIRIYETKTVQGWLHKLRSSKKEV